MSSLNRAENASLRARLRRGLLELGPSVYRLFKLLCVDAFDPCIYANMERVATGAYGVVYFADLIESPREVDAGDGADLGRLVDTVGGQVHTTSVAVKLMNVPKSVHDRCVLHDCFTEILILEHFRGDADACRCVLCAFFSFVIVLYSLLADCTIMDSITSIIGSRCVVIVAR